jgi:hypothetical protein
MLISGAENFGIINLAFLAKMKDISKLILSRWNFPEQKGIKHEKRKERLIFFSKPK